MSVLLTVVVTGFSLLALLIVVPRILMGIRTMQMKGKAAPTPHKPSKTRIQSGKKTILYFFTPQCGACRMQEPIINRLKKRFDDAIYKIDATRNQDAAGAYGVMAVPFLAFIENGQLVSAKAGVQPESALERFLNG